MAKKPLVKKPVADKTPAAPKTPAANKKPAAPKTPAANKKPAAETEPLVYISVRDMSKKERKKYSEFYKPNKSLNFEKGSVVRLLGVCASEGKAMVRGVVVVKGKAPRNSNVEVLLSLLKPVK